jgi:ankyrin repeat protein
MRRVPTVRVIRQIQSENLDDQATLAWILRHVFSVDGHDRAGHSPMTMAAAQGKLGVLRHLYELGGNVSYQQPNGFTILTAAIHNGHYDLARYAISIGCCIHCARTKFPELVDFFRESGGLRPVYILGAPTTNG